MKIIAIIILLIVLALANAVKNAKTMPEDFEN